MGLGAFPAPHEQWLGMLGMHGTRTANYAMDEADLIVAIGARFDDRITGKLSEFAPRAKFVHIDVDPAEISKNVPAHIPIVGDAKDVLPKLTERVPGAEGRPVPARRLVEADPGWQKAYPLRYEDSTDARSSRSSWWRRCTRRPRATRSSPPTSASTRCGRRSTTTSTSRASGSIRRPRHDGLRPAGGYRRKVGSPDETVVCLAGDGSLVMVCQELATAAATTSRSRSS